MNVPTHGRMRHHQWLAVANPTALSQSVLAQSPNLSVSPGEIVQYENAYRLCYLRGPEGIIVALAQELS